MTRVATCPPPWFVHASQQPESSPNPKSPLPVKSLSSHVTKITELPVHPEEDMIAPTVPERNVSPVRIRPWMLAKRHGSGDAPARPCMSLHWSGLIQT